MALISDLDDRSLVEAHQRGDLEAFTRIVEKYGSSLYANALRRLRDQAQAEDAVQEAFLRAFRSLGRFNGDYHLDAWLHRILTNVCIDMGRRNGQDLRLIDRVSIHETTAAPAVDEQIDVVPEGIVEDALERLPDRYREAVTLRFIDDLPYADVANRAGISEENARARVSRGRSMLRSALNGLSGALVFVIAPLRRQLDRTPLGEAPNVADQAASVTQAASTVAPSVVQAGSLAANAAPAVSQATGLVAQAGPMIAQVGPTVASSAPTFGKAAVAVGIAASVAIPAGVAVEKRLEQPAPSAAPVEDGADTPALDAPVQIPATDSSAVPDSHAATVVTRPPTSVESDTVTPGIVAGDETDTTADGDTSDGSTDGSTDPDGSTDVVVPGDSGTDDGSEPDPEAPPSSPAMPGQFASAQLTVTEAGPRLEVSGQFDLFAGDDRYEGDVSGKLLLGEAPEKDADGPRELSGVLTYTFSDGSIVELSLRGTATRQPNGTFDVTGIYRLAGELHGLADAGDLGGVFSYNNGRGSLELAISPGTTATDSETPTAG